MVVKIVKIAMAQQRQLDVEEGATHWGVLGPQASAVQFSDGACNGQPKPAAWRLRISTHEALKDAFFLPRWDTRPGVCYAQHCCWHPGRRPTHCGAAN